MIFISGKTVTKTLLTTACVLTWIIYFEWFSYFLKKKKKRTSINDHRRQIGLLLPKAMKRLSRFTNLFSPVTGCQRGFRRNRNHTNLCLWKIRKRTKWQFLINFWNMQKATKTTGNDKFTAMFLKQNTKSSQWETPSSLRSEEV